MPTGSEILEVAAKEIGYHERANKDTKYGRWYGLNNNPWCMMFALWCYEQAGAKIPFKTASCGAMLRWYKMYRPECIVDTPTKGCLVIFDLPHTKTLTDHVGLFESLEGGFITTIDGNTSSSNDANGGYVNRRIRRKNLVHAYIKPRELEEEMTGKDIYMALSDYLAKQPLPEWAKKEVEDAVKLGITDGSNPNVLIPRYQAAIMAKRAYEKAKKDILSTLK